MTFLEAALEVLKRERKPLHYKDLTERALNKKLLTFVGRTPEVTMQTQLTNAVKKAPGAPFVRVKPGIFGLLRYPEASAEPEPPTEEKAPKREEAKREEKTDQAASSSNGDRGRRRRRGGRGKGRPGGEAAEFGASGVSAGGEMTTTHRAAHDDQDSAENPEEPEVGSLSPEARAAALGETGTLDADDDDEGADEDTGEDTGEEGQDEARGQGLAAASDEDDEDDEDDEEGDEGEEEGAPEVRAEGGVSPQAPPGEESRRPRRRRRRRRRGGENGESYGEQQGSSSEGRASSAPGDEMSGEGAGLEPGAPSEGVGGGTPAPEAGTEAAAQAGRRIMSPIDAAIEILKGQAPGRGVHVRQIADGAVRRRLIHGEPNEAWRVMRAALAAEPRERLRTGVRPRIRAAGSGLYALARRPPDMDLERAEYVFGEARRALRERTLAALEQRLCELSLSGFEAIARVLLQREGFGPATFVKRVEGTVYLEALRGRGSRPSRCLIALRQGSSLAGRRAIGELRAGIRARNQDEGVLMLAGRLAEDGISEWRQAGPPIEVIDGAAMADTCVRQGVGVVNTMVSIDFVDADFFAEISEG